MKSYTKQSETETVKVEEIVLEVEVLEDVIAPGKTFNHNETLVSDEEEIQLEVEDLEDVIAPGVSVNHNETMVSDAIGSHS